MELYERWLETCAECRGTRALRDLGTGKEWSFSDLAQALSALPELEPCAISLAAAADGAAGFVLKTLQAWRDGAVLVPVEQGMSDPWKNPDLARDIVHVKTTSGSTGEPRRVLFTAPQLAADWRQIQSSMRLTRDAPNLAVISLAHSYGFSNLVLPLLLGGMPVIALPDPLPSSLRRGLDSGVPVTLPAVPAMWRAWHQAGILKRAAIACGITAGAPMPLELEAAIFEQDGLKVHNFYGSSECGGIAYDDSERPRSSAEEAGRAMTGVTLSLAGDGCLMVKSAAVAAGYDPADDQLQDGVFHTSDLARVQDGRVYLQGRVTDTIHVAGRKVSPQVVESALLRHPGVLHCVVFGVASPDPARVEEIVACVNTEGNVTGAELQQSLGRELPAWQVPRRWWHTADLLPDARGKLSRALWRERYLASSER